MNRKKFMVTSLVIFIGMFLLDWAFHGWYMLDHYTALGDTLRSGDAQMTYFPSLLIGQLIIAVGFTYIFIKGREGTGCGEGIRYGLIVGIAFGIGPSMINYAVYPLTGTIMLSYFIWYPIECMILGCLAATVYKP